MIWYTGDSYAPSAPVGDLGVHEAEVFALREFLNYSNGRLFATGQDLAWLSSVYGLFPDDFFQYYLGAYTHIESGGMDQDTDLPYPVLGEVGDPVFDGLSFNLTGGDGADNQLFADTFLPTNHFLPHFDTTLAARYDRPGGAPSSRIPVIITCTVRCRTWRLNAWEASSICPRVRRH